MSNGKVSVGPKPAQEAAADAREAAQAASRGEADFVPEKEFKGPREGYIFQKGAQGLGYYLDRCFPAGLFFFFTIFLVASWLKRNTWCFKRAIIIGHVQCWEVFFKVHDGSLWSHRSSKQPSTNGGLGRGRGKSAEDRPLANGHTADAVGDEDMIPIRGGTELSQRELIARAFAGDDVQAEFAEEKVLTRIELCACFLAALEKSADIRKFQPWSEPFERSVRRAMMPADLPEGWQLADEVACSAASCWLQSAVGLICPAAIS